MDDPLLPAMKKVFRTTDAEMSEPTASYRGGGTSVDDCLLADDQDDHGEKVGLENEKFDCCSNFFKPAVVGAIRRKDVSNMAKMTKGNVFTYNAVWLHVSMQLATSTLIYPCLSARASHMGLGASDSQRSSVANILVGTPRARPAPLRHCLFLCTANHCLRCRVRPLQALPAGERGK